MKNKTIVAWREYKVSGTVNAQYTVGKRKNRYNAEVRELWDVLEKKGAQRKQELLKAVENSRRSFDEITMFLKGDTDD